MAEGVLVQAADGGMFVAVKINDGDDDEDPSDNKNGSASSTSSNADDFVGRLVRLSSNAKAPSDNPDDELGLVVAQRTPLLFCYFPNVSVTSAASPPPTGNVQILRGMAAVPKDAGNVHVPKYSALTSLAPSARGRSFFSKIPQVSDIQLINTPALTGITMVDALTPIGKGQNMLAIGTNLDELRVFATSLCKAQLKEGTKCVYAQVQINNKEDEQFIAEMSASLGTQSQEDLVILSPKDDSKQNADLSVATKAAGALTLAASACAVAEEYAMSTGGNAMVVVDTIDPLKTLWDETTKTLVDVFGVDAVVANDQKGAAGSEMRAFYSRLIQRAANFNAQRGGGSVTLVILTKLPKPSVSDDKVFDKRNFDGASDRIKQRIELLDAKKIPLTAANLRKIQIPVPTEDFQRLAYQHVDDLISMSDGQVWFDDELREAGIVPPIDPQKSVTRIGIGADTVSRADAPAIRRIVEGIRLDMAQAASMDGAELSTKASIGQVRKRKAWLLAMHQDCTKTRSLGESCVALLAATVGALDSAVDNSDGYQVSKGMEKKLEALLEHVSKTEPQALEEINSTMDLSPEGRASIVAAIESFFD